MSFTVNRLKQISALSTLKDRLSNATDEKNRKLHKTSSTYLLKYTMLIQDLHSDSRNQFTINGAPDFCVTFKNTFPMNVGLHGADFEVFYVFRDIANIVQNCDINNITSNHELNDYINQKISSSVFFPCFVCFC